MSTTTQHATTAFVPFSANEPTAGPEVEVPATPCTAAAMRYVSERKSRGELARTTERNVTNCLRRFTRTLGCKPCGQITQRDITRWLHDRQHLSQGSRRTEIGIVDGFLTWVLDE